MTVQFVLSAAVTAGLPLFLLSFALVSWALHRGPEFAAERSSPVYWRRPRN